MTYLAFLMCQSGEVLRFHIIVVSLSSPLVLAIIMAALLRVSICPLLPCSQIGLELEQGSQMMCQNLQGCMPVGGTKVHWLWSMGPWSISIKLYLSVYFSSIDQIKRPFLRRLRGTPPSSCSVAGWSFQSLHLFIDHDLFDVRSP